MNQKDKKKGLLLLSVIMFILFASITIYVISSPIPPSMGEYLTLWLFGTPFIFFIAYPWYYLVLYISLRCLLKNILVIKKYISSFVFIVAILAFIIDIAFGQLVFLVERGLIMVPLVNVASEVVLIIVPISVYWLLNTTLSYTYLELDKKQSAIIGIIMGFFNTSWVPVLLPYITGYDGWFVFFPVM